MEIRRAKRTDINGINNLLYQVLMVHHNKRPDIFKRDAKKYTDEEIFAILEDSNTPVFVAVEADEVLGYAFCRIKQHKNSNILTDIKTLYIDDLCVDESKRGKHIGKSLYEYVVEYAKSIDCYNLTLNVWSANEGAMRFYEKCGLVPQKVEMEQKL